MKTIIIMVACVLFLSSFQLSSAEVLKTYIVVENTKNTKAIIYREPTIHSDALRVLPVGSKGIVALLKPRKYAGKQWQNVAWNGIRGWMLLKHLKYDKDTSKKVNQKSCRPDNLNVCL